MTVCNIELRWSRAWHQTSCLHRRSIRSFSVWPLARDRPQAGRAVEMDRATQKGRDDAADDPQPSSPHESLLLCGESEIHRAMTPAMAPMMMAHTICTSCALRPGCVGYGAELLRSMEARPRAWHSQNHIRQENRRAGSGYVSARYRVEVSVRRREPDTVGLASVPSCPDPAYLTSIGLAGLRHRHRAARLPPTTLLSRAGEARRHRAWHLIDQRDSCIQHVSERTDR